MLVSGAEALRAMRMRMTVVRMPVVRMVMRVLVRLRGRMGMAHLEEIYGVGRRERARRAGRTNILGA